MAQRIHEIGAQPASDARWRGLSLLDGLAALLFVAATWLYLLPIAGFADDTDEGVYWQSFRAMASGRPLFSSVFSSQMPLFLPSIYPFYLLFGQSVAAARIGIVIYALVGVAAMYWLGTLIGGRWTGLIAMGLLVVDYHYALQARTLQADVPAVGVEILAVALGVAAARRFGRWRLALAALAGVVAALATMMKVVEVVALVPIALYLGAPLLRAFDGGDGRIQRPTAAGMRVGARAAARDLGAVAAGFLIASVIALAPFAGSLGDIWNQAFVFHFAAAHTQSGSLLGNLKVLVRESRWAGLTAALALGVAVWRRDWRIGPPLLWLLAAVALLVRQVPLFDHIAILIVPCLALMSGLALPALSPAVTRPLGRWLALGLTLVILIVFAGGFLSAYRTARADGERRPSAAVQAQMAAIQAYTQPGETIVTDDQYAAAAVDRNVPPELVDTSFVRVTSGFLTAPQLESLITRYQVRVIVLASGRLAAVPGFKAWLATRYQRVVDLGQGDGLYLLIAPGQSGK